MAIRLQPGDIVQINHKGGKFCLWMCDRLFETQARLIQMASKTVKDESEPMGYRSVAKVLMEDLEMNEIFFLKDPNVAGKFDRRGEQGLKEFLVANAVSNEEAEKLNSTNQQTKENQMSKKLSVEEKAANKAARDAKKIAKPAKVAKVKKEKTEKVSLAGRGEFVMKLVKDGQTDKQIIEALVEKYHAGTSANHTTKIIESQRRKLEKSKEEKTDKKA